MKSVKYQSKAQLEVVIVGCRAMLFNYPEEPNNYQYFADKRACEVELVKRNNIMLWRYMRSTSIFDPLVEKDRYQREWFINRNKESPNEAMNMTAMVTLGWYKLYGTI